MDQNLNTEVETLTKTLCGYLAAAQFGDLSAAAKHEARRGVLDWIGCALAGSAHKTITTLLAVLEEISGRPQATVFGRGLRLGLLDAPLANGQMGHVLDYDDTHMGGVVLHTSSPVLAALFALAERAPVSGADFMLAYAVGFEAGVRAGRTAPGHHKGGWHLTGTLGTIAAGAACGRLLKLPPPPAPPPPRPPPPPPPPPPHPPTPPTLGWGGARVGRPPSRLQRFVDAQEDAAI